MNPRRYSQIERALTILDKSATVDILKDDPYLLFLFKKTERIVSATYILTSLITDNEPLKWELRESVLRLLKDIMSFKERTVVHTKEFVSGTLSALAEVLSLFDIAYVADFISPMNFSVMKKELELLHAIIEGRGKMGTIATPPPFLEEAFFGISKEVFADVVSRKSDNERETTRKREQEDTLVGNVGDFERLRKIQRDSYQGHSDIMESVFYDKASKQQKLSVPDTGKMVVKREIIRPVADKLRQERKRIVIDILQKKGSAIIKDFAEVINGCSEKTIQRLLADLVGESVLKREGERRWSKYSLVPGHIPLS